MWKVVCLYLLTLHFMPNILNAVLDFFTGLNLLIERLVTYLQQL